MEGVVAGEGPLGDSGLSGQPLTHLPRCPTHLASFFECPVCFGYILPPAQQCREGHLVCSLCRPKLTCCPTCRGPLESIRNLVLENAASMYSFPCKYAENGCGSLLLHTKRTVHEDACECRPYYCPCPGTNCKWQGSLDEVSSHLQNTHEISKKRGEYIVFRAEIDTNLTGGTNWTMMQSCFGHNFLLVLQTQGKNGEEQFFAIVLLIGSCKQTEKFAYRLELNGSGRKLMWEATPRSIRDEVESVMLESDCLAFDQKTANFFYEDGNLDIIVTISMRT